MRDLRTSFVVAAVLLPALLWVGCSDPRRDDKVYRVANACFGVTATDPGGPHRILAISSDGAGYRFERRPLHQATPFFLKPSDLGTYLFYDDGGSYLVSDGDGLQRQAELLSDVLNIDDTFESEAEWDLVKVNRGKRLHMRHRRSGRWLTTTGLVDEPEQAAVVRLLPSQGCAEFPEATLDAEGKVQRTRFEDGSLFGIVDTHSHILSNFGFGGGWHLPRRPLPSAGHRACALGLRALPRGRGTAGSVRLRIRQRQHRCITRIE